jgi:hypothetical protein
MEKRNAKRLIIFEGNYKRKIRRKRKQTAKLTKATAPLFTSFKLNVVL